MYAVTLVRIARERIVDAYSILFVLNAVTASYIKY